MKIAILTLTVITAASASVQRPTSNQPASDLQGFSGDRLSRISSVMRSEIDKNTMPGAVTLIARNGHIVHFESHGYLDAAKTKPIPKDAVFRLFSMTKPLVSVAAMMLVEEGKLKLSDPVSLWLPELKDMNVFIEKRDATGRVTREVTKAQRSMTVQDLLRHTSGLAYIDSAPFPEIKQAYLEADTESRESDLSPEEFLKRLSRIPLAWEPGTRWEYSISTDVLGVVLERVSNKRLDVLLDELMFKPLKMTDAGFQAKPAQLSRLADALDSDPEKASRWRNRRIEADPGKRYRFGGAGAVSTAQDYFRFAQMILNGGELEGVRLLSRKTVEYMLSDHIPGFPGSTATTTGPGYGFGLGFAVRRQDGFAVVPGSTGDATWSGAGGTTFTIDPKEKIVGVFMSQAPSTRIHTRFLFKDLLYGALVK